jgi:hypothetical protein
MTTRTQKVFIDAYGLITDEIKSAYTVILQGSYTYSSLFGGYWFEVERTIPQIPMSNLFCETMLLD